MIVRSQIDLTDRLTSGELPCDWPGCAVPTTRLAWVRFDPTWKGSIEWKGRRLRRPWKPQMMSLCPAHLDGSHAVRLFEQFLKDPAPRCPKCTRLHDGCCPACGFCPHCGCPEFCPSQRPLLVPTPATLEEILH